MNSLYFQKQVKMDDLKSLMSLIDANSDKIPEGDYLRMCEVMKGLHGSVRKDTVATRSMDYYDIEEELTRVTLELERLHKERDAIHYRTKMTKAMKSEAIREFAFTEGLHSLREYTPGALQEAGVNVDCTVLYKNYLETYNQDIFQSKKVIHLMVQETREYRDVLVRDMVDVI